MLEKEEMDVQYLSLESESLAIFMFIQVLEINTILFILSKLVEG